MGQLDQYTQRYGTDRLLLVLLPDRLNNKNQETMFLEQARNKGVTVVVKGRDK